MRGAHSKPVVVINVDAKSQLKWNGQEIAYDRFLRLLDQAKVSRPRVPAFFVRAPDTDVAGRVLAVIRQRGLEVDVNCNPFFPA